MSHLEHLKVQTRNSLANLLDSDYNMLVPLKDGLFYQMPFDSQLKNPPKLH